MSRSRPVKANEGLTAEKAAEAIKETARSVREAASAARDTVKVFRESGAIEEIANAAREAAIAARNTTVEIRDAARVVAKELPKPRISRRKGRAGAPKRRTQKRTGR